MVEKDDWRLRGQEEYLHGKKFRYMKFTSAGRNSLHEHCEFCWHKIMEQAEGAAHCSGWGFCTLDTRYWVCEGCFEDFKEMLHWEQVECDREQ